MLKKSFAGPWKENWDYIVNILKLKKELQSRRRGKLLGQTPQLKVKCLESLKTLV